jgi:hypothetical protein
MKLKKGYRLRSLGQEFILVAEGLGAVVDFSHMISMNESAAFLWKEVEEKDFDAEMLANLLTDNYDITHETAQKDVAVLLESWSAAGLIEE